MGRKLFFFTQDSSLRRRTISLKLFKFDSLWHVSKEKKAWAGQGIHSTKQNKLWHVTRKA